MTGALITLNIPTGVEFVAEVVVYFQSTFATGNYGWIQYTGQTNSSAASDTYMFRADNGAQISTIFNVLADTSAQVRYRVSTATTSAIRVITVGWIDTRGK